ncbi:12370_t:CDS:1, partial [Gigaspora margarita]
AYCQHLVVRDYDLKTITMDYPNNLFNSFQTDSPRRIMCIHCAYYRMDPGMLRGIVLYLQEIATYLLTTAC